MPATQITKITTESASRPIEIYRPEEEYDIKMNFLKLELNKHLRMSNLRCRQPPGRKWYTWIVPVEFAAVPLLMVCGNRCWKVNSQSGGDFSG